MFCKSNWILLSVCCFVFRFSKEVAGQDQRGTEFMLSFIDIPSTEGNPLLFISSEERANVSITIPLLGWDLMRTLEPGQSWKKTLPRALRYNDFFTASHSAVYVTSTSSVSVYVYDGMKTKASGYMALPFHALSTSYIAVTYGRMRSENEKPVMLIIAIMDQTTVDVYYKIPSGDKCGVLENGDTSNHVLDAYDVYGMACSGDFTGTRIVSDKPVVVISGHQNIGVFDNSGLDTIQEMLIPEEHFGLNYVLIKHGSKGTINRIVSASDNTQVNSSIGSSFNLNAFEYVDIDTDDGGQQCISSNNPILAISFGKSTNKKTTGDASMCILTANNRFTRRLFLDFGLTDMIGVSVHMYVVSVIRRADVGGDVFSPGVSREVIPTCQYDVLTMRVDEWPLSVGDGAMEFGSYLYGTTEDMLNGISFPLNMKFGIEDSSTSSLIESSSMSPHPSTLHPSSSPVISTSMTSLITVFESSFQTMTVEPALISSSAVIKSSTARSTVELETMSSEPTVPATYSPNTKSSTAFSSLTSATSTLQTYPANMPASVAVIPIDGEDVDVPQSCGCLCKAHVPWNITEEFIEMLRKDITDVLLLKTKNLSRYIRKRTSAHDNRPSAITLGSVGTFLIILTVVVIFVPDVISGLRYLFTEAKHGPKVLQYVSNVK